MEEQISSYRWHHVARERARRYRYLIATDNRCRLDALIGHLSNSEPSEYRRKIPTIAFRASVQSSICSIDFRRNATSRGECKVKIRVSTVRKPVSAAVLLIVAFLIAPTASRAADTSAVPHGDSSKQPTKTSEPAYVKFNVELDNKTGSIPLLFQLQVAKCVTGNFPHAATVKPGEANAFTMKTVNVNRCRNVNKYVMWDVTPQTGASTAPYRLKFIHGRSGDWGTTINVDGNIPPSGAVQTATCNGKNCLNQWFFGDQETFVVIGFH